MKEENTPYCANGPKFPVLEKMIRISDAREESTHRNKLIPAYKCMDFIISEREKLSEEERRARYSYREFTPCDIAVVCGKNTILYIREPEKVSKELTPIEEIMKKTISQERVIIEERLLEEIEKQAKTEPFAEIVLVHTTGKYSFGLQELCKVPIMSAIANGNSRRILKYFMSVGVSEAKVPLNADIESYERGTRLDLVFHETRVDFLEPGVLFDGIRTRHFLT